MVVVALALVCGLAAAVGVNALQNTDTVQVVVAAADIPCHAKLTARDLVLQSRPQGVFAKGTQTRIEDVINKYTNRSLAQGEMIIASGLDVNLVPEGWSQGFLNPAPSSAASLRPGDHVNVYFTSSVSGKGGTTRILENVEVLTMDKEKGLSLKVRPEQEGELAREGKFHLVRRNPNDPESQAKPPEPVQEVKKEIPTVQVVVAIADIPANTKLTTKHLTTRPYLPESVPVGAATRIEDVLHHYARTPISKSLPIIESHVTSEKETPTVQVVVAAADVPVNARITAKDLTMKRFLPESVPAGARTRIEDVVNQYARTALSKDLPIIESQLSSEKAMPAPAPMEVRSPGIRILNGTSEGRIDFIQPAVVDRVAPPE
jgi:Flp pilus assembly protein CpaB